MDKRKGLEEEKLFHFEADNLMVNFVRVLGGVLSIVSWYFGIVLWVEGYYPKVLTLILLSFGIVLMLTALVITRFVGYFENINKRLQQLEKDNNKLSAIVKHKYLNNDKIS